MSVNTPPYVIATQSHTPQLFRQAISSLLSSAGVVESGDYLITQMATPSMNVSMAGGVPGGRAWVAGTTSVGVQGNYFVFNDGAVTQAISTSNPSNPRIDISVIQVQDGFYSGAAYSATSAIVTGTPSGSPVQPTAPASSLVLAAIAVGAAATQILTANITDKRVQATSNVLAMRANPAGRLSTTTQIVVSGAWTQITGFAVMYAAGGMVGSSTSLTIGTAGKYSLKTGTSWQVSSGAPPSGFYQVAIYKNGSIWKIKADQWVSPSAYVGSLLVDEDLLAVGDVLTMYAYCSGTAGTSNLSPVSTFLTASLVSS